ncbi:MAG: DUF2993 domain-containing protein [Microlunatus sp.]|nr:DUF2993 domain-containing protein [Microlunatus sp.]MDN5770739.1 DUF2993 domain-containing protein [Microlunatus sp.]MDN5803005.1 DUF2993 domain-containing protein [Microlunatus sp.]
MRSAATTVQPAPAPPPTRPAAPRSRSVMIAVISVLAVLTVLIVGDRIANTVVENTRANQLQTELSTANRPEVRIGGFPFVTQLLTGKFSSVRVTADGATVRYGDSSIPISHFEATVTDIVASNGYADVTAGQGQATAVVDWAVLSDLVGQRISYAAADRIRVDISVPVGQFTVAGFTARPQVNPEDQTITFVEPKVDVGSVDVPQAVVDAAFDSLVRPYPITDLPYDVKVTGLSVQPDGIAVSGTGQDIPLRGR